MTIEVTEPTMLKFWNPEDVTNTFVFRSGWNQSYNVVIEYGDRDEFKHHLVTLEELKDLIGYQNQQKVRDTLGG
jgi:hypothetical protein